jgi:hypothetical protein
MKIESLNHRNQFELSKRIEILEKQVSELANLTANQVANMPILLVGWAEISAYCRKKPRTLSRYAKNMAFPAYRWGRHVVSSPYTIENWLRAVREVRRKRKTESVFNARG